MRSSRISGKLVDSILPTTLLPGGHLGAGTVSPSEVAIDLPRFLPPVKVPETGFADRRPEPRRSQDTGVPAWKQTYHLPHDLCRTTAPSLVSTGRSRCHFTLISPGGISKVKTPAPADRQPVANPEAGIAEHASGPEAGKASLVLSDAAEESPEYRDAPFGRPAFRCHLKETISSRRA